MIPRHGGLVPEMTFTAATADSPAPISAGRARAGNATAAQTPSPTPTFTRYTLFLPEQLAEDAEAWSSPVGGSAAPLSALRTTAEQNTRLYSFVAAADCPAPPETLQATVVGSVSSAGVYVSAEGVDGLGEADDGPGSPSLGGGGARRRAGVLVKDGEPCRLFYRDAARGARAGWRLASVALPEYEHLTCALLEPAGAGLRARVLDRPIMELRPERVQGGSEGAGGPASAAMDTVNGGSRGISAMWHTVPTTKFNKSDWQSMDAMERAEAAASRAGADTEEGVERRMMGDAGDGDGGGEEGGLGSPARKKARVKPMTSSESAAFTRSLQAALAQNGARLATEVSAGGRVGYEGSPMGRPGASPYAYMSALAQAPAVATTPDPSPPAPPPDQQQSRAVHTVLSAQAPVKPTAPATRTVPVATAPTPKMSPTPAVPVPAPVAAAPAVTLADCGRAVIAQLQEGEQRQYASLKELEKLILRRLPSYETASAKMRDSVRKAEAVAWFRQMQKELKLWLVNYGCTVDPTGLVSFPLPRER